MCSLLFNGEKPLGLSKLPHTIMSFQLLCTELCRFISTCFIKGNLIGKQLPRVLRVLCPLQQNDSCEQAQVKGPSLLLKCVNEIKLFFDLRKLVFLSPAGLIVLDPGCSLSIG